MVFDFLPANEEPLTNNKAAAAAVNAGLHLIILDKVQLLMIQSLCKVIITS
jgi:hypothetical protein